MKTLSLILLVSALACQSFAQSFEGKIVYSAIFKSKVPQVSDELMTELMGGRQEYFIKGAEYFSISNGTLFEWQRYVKNDHRYFMKFSNAEKAYWYDATVNKILDSLVSQNRGVTTVMGYLCDELVFKTKEGFHKYYYSSKVPLDSKLFEKHHYGNLYNFLQYANAVPLKEIVIGKEFSMEMTATQVLPEALDPELFKLPGDIETEPAPGE